VPYEYLEDVATADVAFRAWAPDVEGAFVAAAEATTHALVEDPATIRPLVQRAFQVEAEALDLLLLAFLNELVFLKDAERLLLRVREVRITDLPVGHRLAAQAAGETIDLARHATRVDVKAVTLYRLQVQRVATGWEATVVLDV
jgi:SHS2 domain-containing protein